MALMLSVKAFSVSAPLFWNTLSFDCHSAQLASSFRSTLKTELLNIAYSEHSDQSLPLGASDPFSDCYTD